VKTEAVAKRYQITSNVMKLETQTANRAGRLSRSDAGP
jgi:hypothetical protein